MRRTFLVFVIPLLLLAVIIRARPAYEQVRTLCTRAMGLQGYNIGGTRAGGEVTDGFWYVRGGGTRRWSCTAQEQWWGRAWKNHNLNPKTETMSGGVGFI